jgi:phosphatidylglycerol lysyltransferase
VYQRQGWFFEDLLRTPDAPNGTTELLFDAAMRTVADEGSRYVTLGLAPLAGSVSPWLRFVRTCSAPLYDFDGIRRFKAKLRPSAWTPIHLAWPDGESGNAALLDALSAFTLRSRDGHARGSFVRFGLETLAHAPALGVRVLAVCLVPWTLALALVPTHRFFPSSAVQIAWVGWNVALGTAMLSLAVRWRPPLARALAIATLLDALVTILEVALDGARRARGPLDALVMLVACAGPTLATSQLWGALLWRSRRDGLSGTK